AHAATRQHAEIDTRLFGDAGRFQPARLEGDGGLLFAAPQDVGAVDLARGALEHAIDHTSPPISASSMRTWGAPSVTGSGNCPPLPQPPPIWFQRKSPAMRSIRSSVWNRFPASTTSLTSSAGCPSRIMRP